MKKLLAVFGIGVGVFFAGFAAAETTKIRYIECSFEKESLQESCTEAMKSYSLAEKWMSGDVGIYLKAHDTYVNDKKAKKDEIAQLQEEIIKLQAEADDYYKQINHDALNTAEELVEEKKDALDSAIRERRRAEGAEQGASLINIATLVESMARDELSQAELDYIDEIGEFSSTSAAWEEADEAAEEATEVVRMKVKTAENELKAIIDKRFEDIHNKINNAREQKERTFYRGVKIFTQILDDLDISNKQERLYSDLQLESMFIEAADYFKQAEKLERRPTIHTGGILPGPNDELGQSGTDYLVNSFLSKIVNGALVMLFSIGTIILIIGGLMFLFSSGESEQVTKAKDTIFWGIVGIIIAVMAYAIVKFVVGLDFGF